MTKASKVTANSFELIECHPLAGTLGAEVSAVQLNADLSDAHVAELNAALLQYKVLFFHDQLMNDDDHVDFVRRIGTPADADFIPALKGYPMMTSQKYDENNRMGSDVNFHHDDSFHKYPTKMSILRAIDVPAYGGDTIWVNMEQVYESLSEPLQQFLESMTCEHSLAKSFGQSVLEHSSGESYDKMMARNPPHSHPVVVRHPDTGRKSLYVNELLSKRIHELGEEESDLLLDYLCKLSYRPEFACRFTWKKGSVAWWDNRCTVHRGIDDFYPAVRVMHRVAIAAEQQPSLDPMNTPSREIAHLEIVPCNSLDDQPAGDDVPKVGDDAFLAELNSQKAGICFTPGAGARLKSIPANFRKAVTAAALEAAHEAGLAIIDENLLDKVKSGV